MERNDILNTSLLQLPMKVQAADEGAVQDIAPGAAPVSLAGGAVELELDVLNRSGVVLQRLSDVTPKIMKCWHPDVCSVAKSRCFAVTAV